MLGHGGRFPDVADAGGRSDPLEVGRHQAGLGRDRRGHGPICATRIGWSLRFWRWLGGGRSGRTSGRGPALRGASGRQGIGRLGIGRKGVGRPSVGRKRVRKPMRGSVIALETPVVEKHCVAAHGKHAVLSWHASVCSRDAHPGSGKIAVQIPGPGLAVLLEHPPQRAVAGAGGVVVAGNGLAVPPAGLHAFGAAQQR